MEDQTAIMPYCNPSQPQAEIKTPAIAPTGKQESNNTKEKQENNDTKELQRIKAGILNQAIRRPHNVHLRSSSIESRVVNTLIRFENPLLPRQD